MKKVLTAFLVMLFSVVLWACEQPVDGALAKLDTASQSLTQLINDPSNITGNFQLPSTMTGGVTATWESSETGILSFGEPNAAGFIIATVNRPIKGQGDAKVTITAELKIKSELSDDILTKLWSIELTVKEKEVADIEINTVADILALTDESYDGTYQVEIANMTVFAKSASEAWAYDGTGIIQIYQGAAKDLEVGKVYTVSGTIDWYYGIWEITKSTVVEQAGATPQMPTKEVISSINAKRNAWVEEGLHESAYGSVEDGNFEAVYATVTGKVYMIPGDTGNYNTYLLDVNQSTANWTTGSQENPTMGFMFYYGTSDFAYVKSFNGYEVTMDVVIYTYRSNNHAFAIYYVGGPTGIVAKLNDAQKVEVAKNATTLPAEVVKAGNVSFPTTDANGVQISWAFKNADDANNALVNLTTGAVTLPAEGQVTVTVVATFQSGSVTDTKEISMVIGLPAVSTVAQALAKTSGYVRIQATVVGYSANDTIVVFDGTGFIATFHNAKDVDLFAQVGKKVEILGQRGAYQGLQQVTNYEFTVLGDGDALPAASDLRDVESWAAADLLHLQSGLINLSNMKVQSITANDYGNVDLVLLDEVTNKTIRFFWDSRVTALDDSTFIKALEVGDYVSIEGGLLGWASNNAFVTIYKASQASEGATPVLTDAEELALDKAELTLPATTTEDLVLPATGAKGSTITWATSNDAVIALDGKITRGETDVVVTLTATLVNGEEEDTKVFEITVKGTAVETFTETFDGASELSTNSSSYTNGTYTAQGVVWTWVHAMNATAPADSTIDGAGVLLRRANEPSSLQAVFADGLDGFSFEYRKAFTGGTPRTYKIDVTANGETTTYEIPAFGEGSGALTTVFTYTYDGPALTGEVTVKIYATGNDGNQQMVIDNFSWTK